MSVTTIIEPGQIESTASQIPELRLPDAKLFDSRARRLRQLAEGHRLGDYLRFAAVLADRQHAALSRHPDLPHPEPEFLSTCRVHRMPPLAPAGWRAHPHWQEIAHHLAQGVVDRVPAAGRDVLHRILGANGAWLKNQADLLLMGHYAELDVAAAPIVGAALQVQWAYLAGHLQPQQLTRQEHPTLCPVCGSHPVASIIRIGGAENGLRYLHCALCGSEWHVVRAKCSNCDSSRDLAYYSVDGHKDAVRAEACPECHTYLKMVQQDKDLQVDPVADDLASLALDVLMGEEGYARSGVNYLMIFGTGES